MKVKIAAIIFVYVLIQVIQCAAHRINRYGWDILSGPVGHKRRPQVHVYTVQETGNSALGNYLAHSLTKISRDQYDRRLPHHRYDVYHYTNMQDARFQDIAFALRNINTCDREFQTFCPANTMALCTNNSERVRCLANITSTVPCSFHNELRCVRTSVSSEDNDSLLCLVAPGHKVSITMPCLSTVTIKGYIGYVKNTIVPSTGPSQQEILEVLNNPRNLHSLAEGVEIPIPVHKFCEAIQLKPSSRIHNFITY